jgi:hypothetical protein
MYGNGSSNYGKGSGMHGKGSANCGSDSASYDNCGLCVVTVPPTMIKVPLRITAKDLLHVW